MRKRLYYAALALTVLLLSSFLIYSFSMSYEPTPSKSKVEETVKAYDLEEFGAVESSLLYGLKNYGFYNSHHLYIVERSFGDNEEFSNKLAVIDSGEALNSEEEKLAAQLRRYRLATSPVEKLEYETKHKVRIYQHGKLINQAWFLKVISSIDGENHLSFQPLKNPEESGFNLFKEGVKTFSDF